MGIWDFLRGKRDRVDGYSPPAPPEGDPWMRPEMLEVMRKRVALRNRLDDKDAFDGFVNALTGIGDWTRDKTYGGMQGGPTFAVDLLSAPDAEARWRGSDLGGRIVETIPDEMTREGWELAIQPDDNEDDATEEAAMDAWRDECARNPRRAAQAWRDEARAWIAGDRKRNVDGRRVARACEAIARRWDDAAPASAFVPTMPAAPPRPPGPLPEMDDESNEVIEQIAGRFDELALYEAVWLALAYERAYGGGAILIGANDGHDLSEPLDLDRCKSIDYLNPLTGGWDGEAVAWSYYRNVDGSRYGKPEMYMVRNIGVPISAPVTPGAQSQTATPPPTMIHWVHESRLIIFPGVAVSHRARVQMRGWGDSVFTRINRVLSHYDQTWGGIANLMTDFSQAVLKIDGLSSSMSANNKAGTQNLTKRLQAIAMTRSIARMTAIDAKEELKRETASIAGIGEILDQFALRLAAAADMPYALLMGQVQGGLGDAASGDLRFFYDRVRAKQMRRLLPGLKRLYQLMFRCTDGPTGGVEPERWNLTFVSLYQPTDNERANTRKTVAEADQIYLTAGVVSPEEVAASRFGGSAWSMETTLDLEGRNAMADQAEADVKARAQALLAAASDVPAGDTPPAEPGADPAQPAQPPTDAPTPDAPASPNTVAPVAPAVPAANTALNGAQVTSAVEIVTAVAQSDLPRETGVAMLETFFNLTNEAAERVMGAVGKTFKVEKPTPPPSPFGNGSPPPPGGASPPDENKAAPPGKPPTPPPPKPDAKG